MRKKLSLVRIGRDCKSLGEAGRKAIFSEAEHLLMLVVRKRTLPDQGIPGETDFMPGNNC